MLKLKLICVMTIAVFSTAVPAGSRSRATRNVPAIENSANSQFVVGPFAILMPQGAFLLIRKAGKIGAVRFISIELGSTLGTGKAGYESYFQSDGSGSFRSLKVRKKTGEINLRPLKGIGRFAFQTGNGRVKVGDWSFGTGYPGRLDMWPYRGEEKDYGYEFAPTSAQSLDEIDALDHRLKWFRYTADSKVVLSVSELAK